MHAECAGAEGSRGLTLIEVLVAFVIASLAVVAAMRVFSAGLDGSRLSNDYLTAAMVAEVKLAEAGISLPLAPSLREGLYEDRFAWRLAVARVEPAEERPLMEAFTLTVTVKWRDGSDTRSFTLSSLRSNAAP